MKIILVGFGAIGKGVAKVLHEKRDYLKKNYGDFKVVAITDSSGSAIDENGLDLIKAIEVKETTGSIKNYPEKGSKMKSIDVIREVKADVVVEITPSNLETGEPAKTHILESFRNKKHVVTANKGPLALCYKELVEEAKKHGVMFRHEASVGGAMPIINLAKETLAGNEILSIRGILNGTTNYILTKMEKEGLDFETALKEAKELGIAETDPTQDIEGLDTAAKIVILANSIMGLEKTIKDVKVKGITKITPEALFLANKRGYTIKLIGQIKENHLIVEPMLVPIDSPLNVKGTLNVAMFETDLAREVVVVGRGAGPIETASAILSDLIHIYTTINTKQKIK
ncbi:Homoserine dehydrogenase [Methanocaldococcus vulcanius M7]|uniref:Homoserine dehydrogenase n=1 Tax=Methanocaldococcus vulcanius (strain ATCC 700851 / DSM 12094 / M7) TaxID=579137 RepID=C9RHH2_METVM|nr:homoserine dehydrogenase [Methanocaldococcus vulcanius]ACX73024.1 Homoserine dehydrogenase [Methanocaldococcus vulcanius M7]